jgi:hypothetical protein
VSIDFSIFVNETIMVQSNAFDYDLSGHREPHW